MSSFENYANLAVAVIWVAWLLYWFVSAFGNKTAARVDGWASFLAYRVPLMVAYLLLFGPRLGRFWPWLAQRFLPHTIAWPCVGLAVLLLGLGFACWARVALGRNWSATVQLKQDHELVTAGPYRWVRHPIYTGMLSGVLGSALVIGEWRGLVALALIFAAFAYKLRHEESWMREQFGATYVDYMRRTKALIPGVL
ncbi:isoprenylcysteine carboxylmethyltransferase family protein [Rhodanobacter sp. DHG33]|uniref:methyltransferase family protein n=1 Tax=Rhodanobacter sp. DHG33 TaxID=2775921 RepID=UPI0017807616|nr:isoprenylcysteine carboxylmethyltransferase family protein [Rhodanobacter sp. DHG33]MBD8899588.1 isoprenylcysteine carboxylmethyltransferase family protein [Rhodanobacter sp. DHG33]